MTAGADGQVSMGLPGGAARVLSYTAKYTCSTAAPVQVCNENVFNRYSSTMERTVSVLARWVERRPTRVESML